MASDRVEAEDGGDRPVEMALQLWGASHHFNKPRDSTKHWNENHPGLGLEWRVPMGDDYILKYSLGAMRDSVAQWETQAGVTLQKSLLRTRSLGLAAGAGTFLFYRALKFGGPLQLVPAVLPVTSAEHVSSGLGVNLIATPHIRVPGGVVPAPVYAQLTWRL